MYKKERYIQPQITQTNAVVCSRVAMNIMAEEIILLQILLWPQIIYPILRWILRGPKN